ncbi:MAG: DsbE family thiol:disulfide interchange protein [Pseudomonadota bacterium]
MANVKPLMIAPLLIFAGFVALAGVGMFRADPDNLPSALIGKPAPGVAEKSLAGFPPATVDMFENGEITLVNFWASWCPPCRAEHPFLLQMAKAGIPLVGMNFNDQQATAAKYLRDDDNPFIGISFDPDGRTAIDWGVTAPPETFILDGDGIILFRFAGPLIGADCENRFMPALRSAAEVAGGMDKVSGISCDPSTW